MRRRFGLGRFLERDALGIGLIIAGLDNPDFEECQRLQPRPEKQVEILQHL